MNIETLGAEVKKLRRKKKITQKEIATALNLSRATINKFENAKDAHIGLQKVLDIVNYLEHDIDIKPRSLTVEVEETQWT